MKKAIFLVCSIILILLFTISTNASYNNDISQVRIGLTNYKNLQNISINNTNLQVGYGDSNNFNLIYSLNSNSHFSVKKLNFTYIKLTENFSSYTDALDYINQNSISDKMYVAFSGNGAWSVYIGEFFAQSEAENFAYQKNLNCSVVDSTNILGVYMENEIFFIYNLDEYNLKIKSSDIININNATYRGILEFSTNSSTFDLINILDLEEYLYSVVPAEMPSSWNIEALKAQAVASRSYSYNMVKNSNHKHDGYDLCDTTHCQVYSGTSSEQSSSTNAVNSTSGIMAYYEDLPITAFYYSSNGGFTENATNVWGNSVDYLQSFEDPYETGGKVWERVFTFSELTNLASGIGNVNTITLNFYENSPRVSSLVLTGENGVKTLEKEEIRTFFSGSSGGSLESRNFTILDGSSSYNAKDLYTITDDKTRVLSLTSINVIGKDNLTSNVNLYDLNVITSTSVAKNNSNSNSITISSNDANSFTFFGKGWGHGVGMSQYGANSMANLGYSYDDILKFYYKGVQVK